MEPTTNSTDRATAAAMRSRCAGADTAVGEESALSVEDIPSVAIDVGRQKYVLIRITNPASGDNSFLVRGDINSPYHADAARATTEALERAGVAYEVTGGGRIDHNHNSLRVFGHSYGFGQADHSITARVLLEHFGEGYSIETSNEGY